MEQIKKYKVEIGGASVVIAYYVIAFWSMI